MNQNLSSKVPNYSFQIYLNAIPSKSKVIFNATNNFYIEPPHLLILFSYLVISAGSFNEYMLITCNNTKRWVLFKGRPARI